LERNNPRLLNTNLVRNACWESFAGWRSLAGDEDRTPKLATPAKRNPAANSLWSCELYVNGRPEAQMLQRNNSELGMMW